MTLCKCGCGQEVTTGKRFIHGHNLRCRKKVGPVQGPLQLCECGCGKVVSHVLNRFIYNHPIKLPVQGPLQLCKCGCEQVVNSVGSRFVYKHCHSPKIHKNAVQGPLQLCECGCGNVVTKVQNRFIRGHNITERISKSPHQQAHKVHKVHKKPVKIRNGKNYCRMCKSKNALEQHHLVPRKYGVNNDEYNLITLCKNCHDKVEILTEEWIDSGKEYSALIFRRLIASIW